MEKKIIKDGLEYRAYFLVPYNISPIQQGIQAGHALGRFLLKYGRYNPDHVAWEFLGHHETFIVLNGGTTNDQRDLNGIPLGTLNIFGDQLLEMDIEFSYFIEPDLNNALTALCVICDERVFNYEDYPDFVDYIIKETNIANGCEDIEVEIQIKTKPILKLIDDYPIYNKEWVNLMGGKKNVFLRELYQNKKKA